MLYKLIGHYGIYSSTYENSELLNKFVMFHNDNINSFSDEKTNKRFHLCIAQIIEQLENEEPIW